jgi:hypothetical protein
MGLERPPQANTYPQIVKKDVTLSEYNCGLNARPEIQTFEAINKSRLCRAGQQGHHGAPDFASFSPGFELAVEQRTSGGEPLEGAAARTQNKELLHAAVKTATFVISQTKKVIFC